MFCIRTYNLTVSYSTPSRRDQTLSNPIFSLYKLYRY